MKILGLSLGHGAAAAYVKDGQIQAAIEDDKLTRIKNQSTFPLRAIDFICKKFQLTPQDFDYVAIGCEEVSEFVYTYRLLNKYFGRNSIKDLAEGYFYDGLKRLFPDAINLKGLLKKHFYTCMRDVGFKDEQIRFVNHHYAHATSAYYTSPWKNALIFTNDGKGDGLCGALHTGINGKLTCVDQIKDLNSIGQFYQSVTKFLGYKVNQHEGKITGLAAFGDPKKTVPLMNKVYRFEGGVLQNVLQGNHQLKRDPLNYFARSIDRQGFIHINYIKCLHGSLVNFAAGYQMYLNYMQDNMSAIEPKDMAAGIQQLTEDALVTYLKEKLKAYPAENICLAGGVFANVKVNQRIREIPGVKNVYIQPAMDDAGTSLGAALALWAENTTDKTWGAMPTVYLGPSFTEAEMEEALKKYNLAYRRLANPEEEIGQMMAAGKIIGRFNGALEWGPRALGNRSIIASPMDKTINDSLNQRLKRTEFMPFAPSMLDEDAPVYLMDYTGEDVAVKYMTTTYNTNPKVNKNIDASVHVDGTARPQVVTMADNASFYKIIKAYKKRSGFGVVINTSFNMHEEPIVSSPDDAIRAFLVNAVDVLSLGPFVVEHAHPANP